MTSPTSAPSCNGLWRRYDAASPGQAGALIQSTRGQLEAMAERRGIKLGTARALKPWKLYEVTVTGYGTAIYTGPSRSKVLYRAFQSDAFCHLSFTAFLRIARAKVRREPPPAHYQYIRDAYGVVVKMGDRVRLMNEGPKWNSKEGTVLYPEGPSAHVHILLDGQGDRVVVHPLSVELVG